MEELDGLAFKCIPILHKMMARNFTFTNHKRTEDVAEEYEKMSNPIDTFIKKHCERDADGFIAKTDFKEKLDAWLRATKQRVRVDNQIAQHMKETGIDDRKITFAGVRKNSWVGITWKE
jgi:phage/plasmid-associated DNA primase